MPELGETLMAAPLKNAAAEGLFNDGKPSTVVKGADCPSCSCPVVSPDGRTPKHLDVEACDCRCHDAWRFINRKPVG